MNDIFNKDYNLSYLFEEGSIQSYMKYEIIQENEEFSNFFIKDTNNEDSFKDKEDQKRYFIDIHEPNHKTEVKETKSKNVKKKIIKAKKFKIKGKPKKIKNKKNQRIPYRKSIKENKQKEENILNLHNKFDIPDNNQSNNENDQLNEQNPINKNYKNYQVSLLLNKNKCESDDKYKMVDTINSSSKTSPFSSSEKSIENKPKFITKKRGRDFKNSKIKKNNSDQNRHNRYSFDNIMKKIKSFIINCLLIYSNSLLNEVKYYDNGKEIKFEKLTKINAIIAEETKVETNIKLLNKKIKDILSQEIKDIFSPEIAKEINPHYNNKRIIDKYYNTNKVQKNMNFFELEFRVIFNYLEKGDFYESIKNKDYFILLLKFEEIYNQELSKKGEEDFKIIEENIKIYIKNIEKRKPRNNNKNKLLKKKNIFTTHK